MRFSRLSDTVIRVTLANIPEGLTADKAYLGIKESDDDSDVEGIVAEATPSAGAAVFTITAAQMGTLKSGKHIIAVKVILSNNMAMRLDLNKEIAFIRGHGIEAVS